MPASTEMIGDFNKDIVLNWDLWDEWDNTWDKYNYNYLHDKKCFGSRLVTLIKNVAIIKK